MRASSTIRNNNNKDKHGNRRKSLKMKMKMKMKIRVPHDSGTMNSIHHWVEHTFTHLGWAVLAKCRNDKSKVSVYKKSIGHLLQTIHNASVEYSDTDRIRDLNILKMRVLCLDEFVEKHL